MSYKGGCLGSTAPTPWQWWGKRGFWHRNCWSRWSKWSWQPSAGRRYHWTLGQRRGTWCRAGLGRKRLARVHRWDRWIPWHRWPLQQGRCRNPDLLINGWWRVKIVSRRRPNEQEKKKKKKTIILSQCNLLPPFQVNYGFYKQPITGYKLPIIRAMSWLIRISHSSDRVMKQQGVTFRDWIRIAHSAPEIWKTSDPN